MAAIRCKSCGRVYSYEKNGTCPKCGAYNRPPRKEIVEADGTIHYVTTENKVCYEEEECYEDEVRQSTGTYNYTPEVPVSSKRNRDIGDIADKLRQKRNRVVTQKDKKAAVILAIVAAAVSLVSTLVGNLSSNRHGVPVQEPWESVAVEPATEVHNLTAHVGNEIHTEYGTVTINSCYVKEDVLHLDLCCDDINSLTIMGYYETLTDSGYLKMEEAYSSGDLYTYLASLPDEIDAEDCAVVLDIPFEAGVNRYWIWLEPSTYELGEAFTYCRQRVYVDSWEQENNEVKVWVCAEDEMPVYSEAEITVLNAAEQPYTVYWYGIQSSEGLFSDDSKLRFDFTLRNENDTVQSITFFDSAGNYRQVTVNLQ